MFLKIGVALHLALFLVFLGIPALTLAVAASLLAFHVVLAWGVLHPRSRLFGPNHSRLATEQRVVALTFDDGPHPLVTPTVLEMLRARGARATFFVIGRWVERYPELTRQIVSEGHALGNHSQEHSYNFWALGPVRMRREIHKAQQTIQNVSGAPCRWFRAPVGLKNCALHHALEREGLSLASWSLRFVGPGALQHPRMLQHFRRRLSPGSIVMLHDGHDRKAQGNPAVLEALPILLEALDDMGYRCVALD